MKQAVHMLPKIVIEATPKPSWVPKPAMVVQRPTASHFFAIRVNDVEVII